MAIKLLPAELASDPERRARFEREARLLAALNHPNIAQVYGFESTALPDGSAVHFLAMELAPGEDLAARLKRGAIPVDETIAIAKQLAEALEEAHERGIVHRDLKPANVKLTPEGKVKVLDFGLAKAWSGDGPGAGPGGDSSHSPTLAHTGTAAGIILGTAAYMSPEQARGKSVDKRADIWAFGVLLYEMLSGRRLFEGETVSDVLAAVLRQEIDWNALPSSVPGELRRLLARCLERNPKNRLHDIADARIAIGEADQERASAPGSLATAQPLRRWARAAFAIAGVLIALVSYRLGRGSQRPAPPTHAPAAPAIHSVFDLPAGAPLALGSTGPALGFDSSALAVSPDGSLVAYVGWSGGQTLLFLRELSGLDVRPIPGTEGAIHPFFSPDGRWLGFLTNEKVKKVSVEGGAPSILCDAESPERATWTLDDTIYFAAAEVQLWSVAAGGGEPRHVASLRETDHYSKLSQVLDDGKAALVTEWSRGIGGDYADVVLLSLPSRQRKRLVPFGYDARFVPPDRLLFARAGSLFAVRFDPARGELTGEPVPVASGVSMESFFGQVHAAVSRNGLLVYVPGADRAIGRLAFVSRKGETEYVDASHKLYGVVSLAPAGDRLAVHVGDVTDYVWIYDLKRREGRKLPLSGSAGWPVWSPDGQQIAFGMAGAVWKQALAGDEPARRWTSEWSMNMSWSPDADVLAVGRRGKGIGFVRVGESVEEMPGTNGLEGQPDFSPDGRWVAFWSGGGGRREIWVRSYPDGKTTRQISTEGGVEPVWCPCGELFYRTGHRWMSSRVSLEPELSWEPPRLAFETDFLDTPGRSYDVSADGQRLLVVKSAERGAPAKIHLVSNWMAPLERQASDTRSRTAPPTPAAAAR